MSKRDDWSWSAETLYACPCGSLVAARRWRWIDREARPELVTAVRAGGPLVGACPRCRRPASAGGVWLEVAPERAAATLVLSADRRGDLIAALQAHLTDLAAHAEQAAPWLLQPAVAFAPTPTPWADAEQEVALLPWPGEAAPATVIDTGDRTRAGVTEALEPAQPAAVVLPSAELPGRAEAEGGVRAAVPGGRAEPTGSQAQVPGSRIEEAGAPLAAEVADGREGSGPASRAQPVEPGRRREGSGPTEAVSEARGKARPGQRGAERGPSHESALQDTYPGRRRPRPRDEHDAQEARRGAADGADAGAGRRPTEGDAGAMASGTGRRQAPAEAAGPSGQDPGAMSPGTGRRAAPLSEGAGSSGQDLGGMSPGAGRRPTNLSEGAGPGGQDGRRAEVAGGSEPGPEGERAALRAAVARALTPGATPPAGARAEGGPRPAAVLPGPRAGESAEPAASDSGTAWSKRQTGEGPASESGQAWSKRQTGEGPASESGPAWPKKQASEEAEPARGARPPAPPSRPPAPPAPPPARLGPDVQRVGLATLGIEGGVVQVSAIVNEATARVWATAPIKIRPIHLRGLGYPLVGVRCVAEVGGEPVILDAVVDVGDPTTLEIFKQLTVQFRVRLAVRAGEGGAGRELIAPELQRNAATCLESAQAQLGTGEFPPDAYHSAREVLSARSAAQRLDPARTPLSEALAESCRESAASAWAALERLDQASKKDNLARLLEIEGLPIETYEKVRSAVLAAAIEFGLPAPARFWRRWLGSDQAKNIGVFVQRLVAARSASIGRGEDLTAEQVETAWRGILDLCQHKNLTPPPELSKALGLGKVSTGRRASQPQIKVAAEVRDAPASAEASARSHARRRELAAKLRGTPSEADIRASLAALAELSEDDVVSLLPAIAELGTRAMPELVAGLRAPQRQVRQAAAIVLGHVGDRKAEGPLVAMLGDEPSAAWVDAACALGNLGPRVVGPLCTLLRGAPAGRKDLLGARVARALAELVKVEGAGPGGSGRQTVENLLDVGDPSVASAARRALATLGGVREEVDGDEAEASRRFSRLASDAFAPELDAAADDELDEVDVEVGD